MWESMRTAQRIQTSHTWTLGSCNIFGLKCLKSSAATVQSKMLPPWPNISQRLRKRVRLIPNYWLSKGTVSGHSKSSSAMTTLMLRSQHPRSGLTCTSVKHVKATKNSWSRGTSASLRATWMTASTALFQMTMICSMVLSRMPNLRNWWPRD